MLYHPSVHLESLRGFIPPPGALNKRLTVVEIYVPLPLRYVSNTIPHGVPRSTELQVPQWKLGNTLITGCLVFLGSLPQAPKLLAFENLSQGLLWG